MQITENRGPEGRCYRPEIDPRAARCYPPDHRISRPLRCRLLPGPTIDAVVVEHLAYYFGSLKINSDVYHYVGTPTDQHYTSLLSKSTMSYTISARGASGRYMPETTENERFWASLHAKNRKRPPKWPPKITENDPPWHISSKGIFGGPAGPRRR